MKIVDVKVTPVYVPFDGELLWAWGSYSGCRRILVEVVTDEGYVGLGEANGYPARLAALEHCRPVVVGEDPFHTEAIRAKFPLPFFHGNAYLHAFAAIEFACLDIQGQVIGRPIYDLFGGMIREKVPVSLYILPCYGSDLTRGDLTTPEEIVPYARSMVDEFGFRTLKLKGGIFAPEHECAVLSALRESLSTHNLRLDPNGVWSVGTTLRMADRLRPLSLEYLEDPTWGARGMAQVNSKVPWIPLATNMCVLSFDDLVKGTMLNSIAVLLCDAHWYGGIRATTQLARMCETFNLDMGMHSGNELGVSMAVELHVGAIIPNLSHAIDQVYSHLLDDVIVGGKLKIKDGVMQVPSSPGLGVKLDESKVAKYHEEFLRHGLEPHPEEMRVPSGVNTLPRW